MDLKNVPHSKTTGFLDAKSRENIRAFALVCTSILSLILPALLDMSIVQPIVPGDFSLAQLGPQALNLISWESTEEYITLCKAHQLVSLSFALLR